MEETHIFLNMMLMVIYNSNSGVHIPLLSYFKQIESLVNLLFVISLAKMVTAQTTRAIRPVVLPNGTGEQSQLYQNSHALLISFRGKKDNFHSAKLAPNN